jgi:hypothetical protein
LHHLAPIEHYALKDTQISLNNEQRKLTWPIAEYLIDSTMPYKELRRFRADDNINKRFRPTPMDNFN